jgi:dTDP-4-dehydrorhamnose 3,5-epimerase-like enzyme
MLIEYLQPDFTFEDDRGSLNQLAHEGYKQVNVVYSKAGVLRGNHYHKENKEVFYVIRGSFNLTVSKKGIEEKYHFGEGQMFLVPPMVMHSFQYLEDTDLIAMYDQGVEHEDGTKDIYVE